MPLDLQAVLLRVIEQKNFMKIGSSSSTNLDVRIIAATNKNLKEKVQKGEFREDLYYRLGIIRIVIPPLRSRQDDILLLAEQFIEKICNRINKPLVTLSSEVKDFFLGTIGQEMYVSFKICLKVLYKFLMAKLSTMSIFLVI